MTAFLRTVAQAEELGSITDIDYVINVDVPDEKLVSRIAGRRSCSKCSAIYQVSTYNKMTCEDCGGDIIQRPDDREETVRNRLNVYHEKTKPLIDYYRERKLLSTVDGDKSIQEIFDDICSILT